RPLDRAAAEPVIRERAAQRGDQHGPVVRCAEPASQPGGLRTVLRIEPVRDTGLHGHPQPDLQKGEPAKTPQNSSPRRCGGGTPARRWVGVLPEWGHDVTSLITRSELEVDERLAHRRGEQQGERQFLQLCAWDSRVLVDTVALPESSGTSASRPNCSLKTAAARGDRWCVSRKSSSAIHSRALMKGTL